MVHATRLVVIEGVQLGPSAKGGVVRRLDDIIEVVGDSRISRGGW